jgi:transglutaminase-like putative cysteine protease
MKVEAYRTTKAEALKKAQPGGFDLFWNLAVKVERPLPKPFDSSPHSTQRIRYRVTLKDADPAKKFASGASQQVKSIDAHTAEVTVYAIRPGHKGGNPAAPDDPPSDADRQPNNWIQSDYRKIVALAQQAAGEAKDPREVAQSLERFVHRYITTISFSQALATAAEVADKPTGDCKAHAMLLAALCRARGIPARVAIGLLYMGETRSFAYHMWTVAYIDKRWIPLDATLGRGGIGAAHLEVLHSSLQGASALSCVLPVAEVAGSLKIEILDVE